MTGTRNKPRSQGGKVVPCVRCKGDIQPFAGVAADLYAKHFTHHPGNCAGRDERQAEARGKAAANGFAWSCRQLDMFAAEVDMCDAAGADRESYLEHMRKHGGPDRISGLPKAQKLRKRPPAAPRVAPVVPPFKQLRWTERKYADWKPDVGNELIAEVERRGQFWSNADANSVWVIPLERAPWESTSRPLVPVSLYLTGIPGKYTADWSEARRERKEAKRRAGYREAA